MLSVHEISHFPLLFNMHGHIRARGSHRLRSNGDSRARERESALVRGGGLVIFDLENQLRFEARENTFDFNDGVDALTDDAWLLNRFRLGLTLKPTPWLKLYFQGQDSREMDSDRPNVPGALGAEGDNPFDLRQAWIELGGGDTSPFSLKAGRQVLLYGDQRLIGPMEWSNLSRTFDAVKLRWAGDNGLWVDAFTSSVVVPNRDHFDESDHDSVLSVYMRICQTLGRRKRRFIYWPRPQ